MYKNIVGIDLGTTNVVYAYKKEENGEEEYVVGEGYTGNKCIPSFVYFKPDGDVKIGIEAQKSPENNYKYRLFGSKRLLGRKKGEKELEEFLKSVPFEYEYCDDESPVYVISSMEKFAPEEISALLLSEVKRLVKEKTGEYPDACVITIPAYFNENQRQATLKAAEIAELNCIKLIHEPTAAAMAYRQKAELEEGNVLVFDFGGGTLDVSILSVNGDNYKVVGISGKRDLGGELIDELIVDRIIEKFKEEKGVTIDKEKDKKELTILRNKAIEAKHALTFAQSTDIYIEDLSLSLSRDDFEELCENLFDDLQDPINEALEEAHLETKDIKNFIMVGGSSQIPAVKDKVEELLEDKKELEPEFVDVDQAVAIGALIVCDKISKGELNTDPKKHISTGINLIDKIPLAVGVRHDVDKFTPFINSNADIPTEEITHIFRPQNSEATNVSIEILQGNGDTISSEEKTHVTLRKFEIDDLPLRCNKIVIKGHADENGILHLNCEYGGKKKEIKHNLFESHSPNKLEHQIEKQRKRMKMRCLHIKMGELLNELEKKTNDIEEINEKKFREYNLKIKDFNDNAPKTEEELEERIKEIENLIDKI